MTEDIQPKEYIPFDPLSRDFLKNHINPDLFKLKRVPMASLFQPSEKDEKLFEKAKKHPPLTDENNNDDGEEEQTDMDFESMRNQIMQKYKEPTPPKSKRSVNSRHNDDGDDNDDDSDDENKPKQPKPKRRKHKRSNEDGTDDIPEYSTTGHYSDDEIEKKETRKVIKEELALEQDDETRLIATKKEIKREEKRARKQMEKEEEEEAEFTDSESDEYSEDDSDSEESDDDDDDDDEEEEESDDEINEESQAIFSEKSDENIPMIKVYEHYLLDIIKDTSNLNEVPSKIFKYLFNPKIHMHERTEKAKDILTQNQAKSLVLLLCHDGILNTDENITTFINFIKDFNSDQVDRPENYKEVPPLFHTFLVDVFDRIIPDEWDQQWKIRTIPLNSMDCFLERGMGISLFLHLIIAKINLIKKNKQISYFIHQSPSEMDTYDLNYERIISWIHKAKNLKIRSLKSNELHLFPKSEIDHHCQLCIVYDSNNNTKMIDDHQSDLTRQMLPSEYFICDEKKCRSTIELVDKINTLPYVWKKNITDAFTAFRKRNPKPCKNRSEKIYMINVFLKEKAMGIKMWKSYFNKIF